MGVIVLLATAPATYASAELILNEALANEPGGATPAEWVEIINWPDTGTDVVALTGYRFIDGNDTTTFEGVVLIPPGGFVVLARRVTGDDSFEANWGDDSGVWGDAASEHYPVIAAAMALRNRGDTVTLIAPTGETSSIFWDRDADDGTSLERVRPDHPDVAGNFLACLDPTGSTPGRTNSVVPLRGDLALDSFWVATPDPLWGQPLILRVAITNVGIGRVIDIVVRLYADLDFNSPGAAEEIIIGMWIDTLYEGESRIVEHDWRPAPGQYRVVARLDADANPGNSIDKIVLATIRHSRPLVVISEFLANPVPDGPGEWIEISNQASFAINMRLVSIGDADGESVLFPPPGMMPTGAFWVLAQNEAAFLSYYPDFGGMMIGIPGWNNLNNGGDLIRLLGAGGEIIDSVTYGELYDDNRSVERLDLAASFAAPDAWAGSVDAAGATPGRKNSQSESLAGTLSISASPNPLYLSSGRSMEITLTVDIGETVTLRIFSRAGNLVKTQLDNVPAASGVFTWDGSGDNGSPVAPGMYILLVESEPSGRARRMMIAVAP